MDNKMDSIPKLFRFSGMKYSLYLP